MTDTDRRTSLGVIRDWLGQAGDVSRDDDRLNLTYVEELLPAGARELEKRIAAYWTSLARWRASNLELEGFGIDLDECREILADLPGIGDASDFGSIDWHEVGLRLQGLRQFGGYGELSRLHALLTCDDPEVFRG